MNLRDPCVLLLLEFERILGFSSVFFHLRCLVTFCFWKNLKISWELLVFRLMKEFEQILRTSSVYFNECLKEFQKILAVPFLFKTVWKNLKGPWCFLTLNSQEDHLNFLFGSSCGHLRRSTLLPSVFFLYCVDYYERLSIKKKKIHRHKNICLFK